MKPLVIYHASCADGFGAAFAAWLKLGDEAEYEAHQYGADVSPDMMAEHVREREVYILDFSFPKLVMDHIFKAAKHVAWLDHHKSAFEMWCESERNHYVEGWRGDRYIELCNGKSGAYLAWQFFHPGTEVPMFIRHIDDYDRWIFALEGTKAFNKGLWSHTPWSFALWKHISTNKVAFKKVIDEGNAILRAHEQNVQSVVKGGARKCEIRYYIHTDRDAAQITTVAQRIGLAANCPPHLASDVGHELATQSGTYGLLWSIDKNNICKCSLRSNGDYDVSAIARNFGGGGHRNAAGFSVDIQTLLEWIK